MKTVMPWSTPRQSRHDPTFLRHGRGRWCECSCGWRSGRGNAIAAQLAFGSHLLRTKGTS